MRNYIIHSLSFFTQKAEWDFLLSNPEVLPLSILKQVRMYFRSRSCTHKQLAKIWGRVLEEIGKAEVEELIPFRHGQYPLTYKNTIEQLLVSGLIKVNKEEQFIISSKGIEWLDKIINETGFDIKYKEIISYIDVNLFKNLDILTREVVEKTPYLDYKSSQIGQYKMELIFDWSIYGDGALHPYHYLLLASYKSMVEYFEDINNIPEHFQVKLEEINPRAKSSQLEILRKKYAINPKPLSAIFEKQEPKYLLENKYEGKNYVQNTWYLMEAINLLHIFENIAPNINELTFLTLINLDFGTEKIPENEKLNRKPSRYIKNDINNLVDWGLLKKLRYKGEVRYILSALAYYDEKVDRTYELTSKGLLEFLFNKHFKAE